jgi:hypothetical protein
LRIVYFDIDSLRPDHLGCYGYGRPTSPAIDEIAAQGMRFDRYYCADSPCMPSRHGWISGRFGINNGVVTHGGPASKLQILEQRYGGPDERNQLVQRKLRQHGYDTVCFSNFPTRHCATWFGLGWSEFHSPNLKTGSETADEVNEAVLRSHLWAVDRNITATYVADVVESVNAYLRELTALGAILGGRCWADPDLNPQQQVQGGRLFLDFDFTPAYPAERITFRSRLVGNYAETIF